MEAAVERAACNRIKCTSVYNCSSPLNLKDFNIGIKHDFPFINIRKIPREVFSISPEGP